MMRHGLFCYLKCAGVVNLPQTTSFIGYPPFMLPLIGDATMDERPLYFG